MIGQRQFISVATANKLNRSGKLPDVLLKTQRQCSENFISARSLEFIEGSLLPANLYVQGFAVNSVLTG